MYVPGIKQATGKQKENYSLPPRSLGALRGETPDIYIFQLTRFGIIKAHVFLKMQFIRVFMYAIQHFISMVTQRTHTQLSGLESG